MATAGSGRRRSRWCLTGLTVCSATSKKASRRAPQLSTEPMKLLTKAIRASLPPIGAQDGAVNPIAHIKFFTPDGAWTWYATEGSPMDDDFMFFGYVIGIV